MDDAELLNKYWKERSQDAFGELVRRHFNLVYAAAFRRLGGDSHRAQDMAQTVFAELARQAPRLSGRTSLEGWLYTTTRNVTVQTIRTEQRRMARDQAAMAVEFEETPSEFDAGHLRPVIYQALDRLNARDRELVLHRFFSGWAFGEIARRDGISEDAARFRLNRALDRMRALLAKNGITSVPAALAVALSQEAGAAVNDGLIHTVTAGALAKVASSGAVGGSIQLLQIMSSTKAAAVSAIMFACIGGLLLHREYATLQSARSGLAQRTTEYRETLAQLNTIRAASTRLSAAVGLAASLPAGSSGATVSGSATAQAGKPGALATEPRSRTSNSDVNWALSRDPQVRSTLAIWTKSAFHAGMTAFYRQENLTPEQVAAYEDLRLQQNINMGPGAILTLRPEDKTVEQVDADIHLLLGDAAFLQLQQYRQTEFLRPVSNGIAALVYQTDTPMTPELAEQLTRILADSSPVINRPSFPKDIDWNTALPRAQGILSPAQFIALQTLAPSLSNAPGALNPTMPGTYGDGVNPPPFLYTPGGKLK